jgi:hypothetical protein
VVDDQVRRRRLLLHHSEPPMTTAWSATRRRPCAGAIGLGAWSVSVVHILLGGPQPRHHHRELRHPHDRGGVGSVGWQRRPACLPAGTDLRRAADTRWASVDDAFAELGPVQRHRRGETPALRPESGPCTGWGPPSVGRGRGVAIAMPWTTAEGSSWRAPCTALEVRSSSSQAGPAGGSAAGTTAACRRRPCRGEVPSATSGRTPPPGRRLPHPPSPDNSALDMAAGHRSSPVSRLPPSWGRHCFGRQARGGCHQAGQHRNPSQPCNWRAGDCQVPDGCGRGIDWPSGGGQPVSRASPCGSSTRISP